MPIHIFHLHREVLLQERAQIQPEAKVLGPVGKKPAEKLRPVVDPHFLNPRVAPHEHLRGDPGAFIRKIFVAVDHGAVIDRPPLHRGAAGNRSRDAFILVVPTQPLAHEVRQGFTLGIRQRVASLHMSLHLLRGSHFGHHERHARHGAGVRLKVLLSQIFDQLAVPIKENARATEGPGLRQAEAPVVQRRAKVVKPKIARPIDLVGLRLKNEPQGVGFLNIVTLFVLTLERERPWPAFAKEGCGFRQDGLLAIDQYPRPHVRRHAVARHQQ